jgi:primosomal protein N''
MSCKYACYSIQCTVSFGRSHLLTTALHLHHVNITSNHVTAIINSKFCAHLRSLFSAQLSYVADEATNYLDQLIKEEDPESVRRSHWLGIRYAWSFY